MEPLHQAVAENARNAALRDPRFPPVQPDELDKIKIEISVLTEPQPLRVQFAGRSAEQTAAQRGRRAAAHRPAHGDVSAAGLGADSGQGRVPESSFAEGRL